MLQFGESFLSWVGATAIPAFLGLLIITAAGRRVDGKYLSAFALGVFMWFFVDTISGSGTLDVSAGFGGGVDQLAIVALFALGVLIFFSVGGDIASSESGRGMSLAIPAIVAIAVGIHGLGEGTAFGSTASSTPTSSLLDAFGGTTAGVAYALHKAFEPMMIGACYSVYSKDRSRIASKYLADIAVLTVLFVVPSLIGAVSGYFVAYDATYFFALGTGTSLYAALRLARPVLADPQAAPHYSAKVALALVLGFVCIYLAALLHS